MKRGVIIGALALILAISLISSAEIETKESFMKEETFLAKVSGNFIDPILAQNVFFYRTHVRVPVDYSIIKINEDYYIYAVLSNKAEGNYSISIKDVKYMRGPEIVDDEFSKNFSILNETASFSVRPGVLSVAEEFMVEVQNIRETSLIIDISTAENITGGRILVNGAETSSLLLKSGEIGKVNFAIGKGEPILQFIKFSADSFEYSLPVFVYSEEGISQGSFGFEFSEQSFSFPTNLISKKIISIYNPTDVNITGISFSLSDSIASSTTLSKNEIEIIEAHSFAEIELSFLSIDEKEISGTITAQAENLSASASLSITFVSNYTSPSTSVSKTCAELNGTIYDSETEICSAEVVYASDNICCIGIVSKKEENKSTGKIIAIVIIAVIVLGLVWFYLRKYKRTKRPVNLLNVARGKR